MKKHLLLALTALMLLSACRSSRKAVEKNTADITAPTTTVTTPTTTPGGDFVKPGLVAGTNFTSKVKVTISQDGKDISTSGTLRMRYDDVIQLTLVDPLIGIAEIGRMELSPDRFLIIDRVNKRYVDATYEELGVLQANNLGFDIIQKYFWEQAQGEDHLTYTIPAKTPIQLDLRLSDKGNAANWNAHTTVSNKYTKTDANRLINTLTNQ